MEKPELQAPDKVLLTHGETITIDVLRIVRGILRNKLRLVAAAVLGAVLGYGLSYTRPKLYSTTLKFMPPARTLQSLYFTARGNAGDEYRALLTSDTVAADVTQHLDLTKVFKTGDPEVAAQILQGSCQFGIDSNNFVTITATSQDPLLAQKMANEYYAALYRMTQRLASGEATHRLEFMAGPLEVERAKLAEAETALAEAQKKTGLVLPQAQGALGVQQVASLEGRISDLNAQLARERLSGTDENPQVRLLLTQIADLQGQLASLQRGSSQVNSPSRLPELSLEVERSEREVRFHTATLDALTRSMQLNQTEATYTPSLSLIDPAPLPKRKSSPSRAKWAMGGGVLLFLITLVYTLRRILFQQLESTPSRRARLAAWKASFRDGSAA